uniref:Uncharacterized protein n=1 Tax=Timema monikensis TaxID=170555 RepID=A0A7R9ELN7_9NEOP|nr:unnamed protein product [Timema monikensis]
MASLRRSIKKDRRSPFSQTITVTFELLSEIIGHKRWTFYGATKCIYVTKIANRTLLLGMVCEITTSSFVTAHLTSHSQPVPDIRKELFLFVLSNLVPLCSGVFWSSRTVERKWILGVLVTALRSSLESLRQQRVSFRGTDEVYIRPTRSLQVKMAVLNGNRMSLSTRGSLVFRDQHVKDNTWKEISGIVGRSI